MAQQIMRKVTLLAWAFVYATLIIFVTICVMILIVLATRAWIHIS